MLHLAKCHWSLDSFSIVFEVFEGMGVSRPQRLVFCVWVIITVYNDLFIRLHVQGKVVVAAPLGQKAHFTPVVGLVIVADVTYQSCVICKFDEEVVAV